MWIPQVAAFEIQQAWRLFEQRIRSRKGFFGAASVLFLGTLSAMKYTATIYFFRTEPFFAMNFNHGVQSYKLEDGTRSPIEGILPPCNEGVWTKAAGRNKSSWFIMQRCLQRHFLFGAAFLLFHVYLALLGASSCAHNFDDIILYAVNQC